MKLPADTRDKILRDATISLFIYALPVILMFLSFWVTGKKPWKKKEQTKSEQITHR